MSEKEAKKLCQVNGWGNRQVHEIELLTIQERIAQSKYAVGDPLLMKETYQHAAEEYKKARFTGRL